VDETGPTTVETFPLSFFIFLPPKLLARTLEAQFPLCACSNEPV